MIPYENIFSLLHKRTGLTLDTNKRTDVTAVIEDIFDKGLVANPQELMTLLFTQPTTHPIWQRLTQAVTIGETYFYRNFPQFQALHNEVLPELIAERRKADRKQLRIWSSACATGEEPYSIAMMVRDLLPDFETWSVTILATDINEDYLEKARQGIYKERSFRTDTPDDLRDRWFTKIDNGYQIDSTIRNMVVFRQLNLKEDGYPAFHNGTMFLDVIFCRNVTIYFERETTRQVISRFHQALNANGWLVVGHSEPQANMYDGFDAKNFVNTVFYRKQSVPDPLELLSKPPVNKSQPPKPTKPTPKVTVKPVTKPVTRLIPAPLPTPKPPRKMMNADLLIQAKEAADAEKWDEALAWLDEAETLGEFEPHVYYLRGLVALNQKENNTAIELIRRAIYCDSNFALAHYTLGILYSQEQAHKEAVRHWRWALRVLPLTDERYHQIFGEPLTEEILNDLLEHQQITG